MGNGNGLSGISVAVATVGGILVYAGFRGVSPLDALRNISTGKPTPVNNKGTDITGVTASTPVAGAVQHTFDSALGGIISAAAAKYSGDRYSQAKRTQPGYSDCSSFADKVLTDVGIPPPVKWASTANYRLNSHWVTIPQSQAMPGDVAVSSHHMVLVTSQGGASAIGQQNPTVNVRTGSVAQLMGSQTYVYKRYTP